MMRHDRTYRWPARPWSRARALVAALVVAGALGLAGLTYLGIGHAPLSAYRASSGQAGHAQGIQPPVESGVKASNLHWT